MAQGFLHGVDLLPVHVDDLWPDLRSDLVLTAMERQLQPAARAAAQRLPQPEERRHHGRSSVDPHAGCNPTITERRFKVR